MTQPYCQTNPDFDALLREMGELHDRKNAGYALENDPLHNFRACEAFGIPMYQGLAVRITDKQSRWQNLLRDAGLDKVGESLEDTSMDMAVYLLLFLVAYKEYNSLYRGEVQQEELCFHDGQEDKSDCKEADGYITDNATLDTANTQWPGSVTVGWTPSQYENFQKTSWYKCYKGDCQGASVRGDAETQHNMMMKH